MVARRTFVKAALVTQLYPLATWAQRQAKVFRVGILETTSPEMNSANFAAFKQGLQELGYVEGQNVVFEYRSSDGRADRFPALANELVAAKVDIIVTRGTPAAVAANNAPGAIPVVMAAIGEPLGPPVISSIARPGGKVTGLSAFSAELAGKRIEILWELVPRLSRVGALYNMSNPLFAPQWKEIQEAARKLNFQPVLLDVRKADDLNNAFVSASKQRVGAVDVGIDGMTQANRSLIAELAAKYRVPCIYASKEFVDAGGLISYGVSYPHLYYRAASFVVKVFNGTKPGDIPVELPIKSELALNKKAANTLSLSIPAALLIRADHVIG